MRSLREIYYINYSVACIFDATMLEKVSWTKRISRKERKDAKILKNIKSIKRLIILFPENKRYSKTLCILKNFASLRTLREI